MKILNLVPLLILVAISPLKGVDFPEIKGWKPISAVVTYNPDKLYEYINGGAEQYLAYGFQFLQTRDLSRKGLKVSVDIYDMGTPLNAFGIYKTERPNDRNTLMIGVEAVISPPYQCLLLKDCYYVKVSSFEGKITDTTGKELLESIADALPGTNSFPNELQLLPSANKIPDSEGFTTERFLGLTELINCIHAKYRDKGKVFQYFVIIPIGKESIESIWGKLSQKWKKIEHNKHTILMKKIPYKGMNGVVFTEQKIMGVTDCRTEVEMLKRLETLIIDH